MNRAISKVKGVVSSVKEHWNTPPEGRYVPYKEILSYSVGGIGVKFLVYTIYDIGLSATSLLAGAALGLKNGDLVKPQSHYCKAGCAERYSYDHSRCGCHSGYVPCSYFD